VGVAGVAGHWGPGAGEDDPGYFGHLAMTRNVSAVTAACLALRKSVFDEVGGLDAEALTVAFNDVDLCLKIRAGGYDIVWTPFAQLIHHESASRGSDLAPAAQARFNAEIATMRDRWPLTRGIDPFYGPNFDRMHTDFRLAYPPVIRRPWAAGS
jgi:GT2 family glycosyltransferase